MSFAFGARLAGARMDARQTDLVSEGMDARQADLVGEVMHARQADLVGEGADARGAGRVDKRMDARVADRAEEGLDVRPGGPAGVGMHARKGDVAFGLRGVHALAIAAIVLAAVAVRATEAYATRYQSLPALDWIESRPPLVESAEVPAAADLSRGLARALPLLTIRQDAQPRLPSFGPPGVIQRTVAGVRDAARIELASPGSYLPDQIPLRARLDVIVFNRALRAVAWSEVMAREMDIRDPETGLPQVRLTGPAQADALWIGAPSINSGSATTAGRRGAVGFVLQVTYFRRDASDAAAQADLSARAEALARQAAADWSEWLTTQLAA
jgi:hypothetical protein